MPVTQVEFKGECGYSDLGMGMVYWWGGGWRKSWHWGQLTSLAEEW